VGAMMDQKPGDPPLPGQKHLLVNPSIEEIHQFCMKRFDEEKARKEANDGEMREDEEEEEEEDGAKKKPMFGPKRPPGM
jgi:hypothetical protein